MAKPKEKMTSYCGTSTVKPWHLLISGLQYRIEHGDNFTIPTKLWQRIGYVEEIGIILNMFSWFWK